ncbi:hypothetical protein PENSUB_6438 [Penicillium subrubescens]|uniref:Uncharacterized protein n=1 Tax=Penicillium subrubescens TaxID=1316194 RepID=A0A1Q5U1T6_9EURO|nr:hypothetical protein PENSUB_6438 [Penicillium subrubescens]
MLDLGLRTDEPESIVFDSVQNGESPITLPGRLAGHTTGTKACDISIKWGLAPQ